MNEPKRQHLGSLGVKRVEGRKKRVKDRFAQVFVNVGRVHVRVCANALQSVAKAAMVKTNAKNHPTSSRMNFLSADMGSRNRLIR